MIKFQVDNMSCGSCRVKVKAKLEDNGFKNVNIDVNDNFVTMDGTTTVSEVVELLDSIKYKVDEVTFINMKEHRFFDDVLLDEYVMNQFNNYLEEHNIKIADFDEEEVEYILLAEDENYQELLAFIETLK